VISDEELALQLQKGQRVALATLVERHYNALLGYLYRLMSGDRALAEDLVQETFLRVLSSARQYQHPRPFKPWLYAIATNLAHNHYKRADTRYTHVAGEDDDAMGEWDSPEDALLAQDEVQAVVTALAMLPDEQREVIVLYYYQSLEGPEIAAALGIPLGTVRSRLASGVRRLRQWMEEKAL
jgi:RNA polymerase sigma-70 factor (ECF subfamily)